MPATEILLLDALDIAEGAVVEETRAAMADGKPRMLEFSVSNEQAWEVGLACGGTIEIFVETLE